MTDMRRGRRIATLIVLAGLGVGLAACVSDLGASTGETTGAHQMRYYGGPKSPMWPGQ